MKKQPDLVERILLRNDLFEQMIPRGPISTELVLRVREASEVELAGENKIGKAALDLVRGAMFYAVDALDECHRIFQEDHSDLGSYWHGMMHRREGDFDNARYWFRRAGRLPISASLHEAAVSVSPLMGRQPTWDAYVLTGECEQAAHGDEEKIPECRKLLLVEFEGLVDYCLRS